MKNTIIDKKSETHTRREERPFEWLVIGGGRQAVANLQWLLEKTNAPSLSVLANQVSPELKNLLQHHPEVTWIGEPYDPSWLLKAEMVIASTGERVQDQRIAVDAISRGCATAFSRPVVEVAGNRAVKKTGGYWYKEDGEFNWQRLSSRLVVAFCLMVVGHVLISYLPLPSAAEVWTGARPYFNQQFLLFVLAGFAAQMVDGVLSMGYGVTSATCLMSLGISPVSVSAAIHTSEIFTTGVSGYSHYKFGNVNKKMFRHLVIPGVIGAVAGALMLVFLGDKSSKWLMPVIALYAGFLGLKILVKAFQQPGRGTKVKRIGWLAWIGGFLDSFGGGGWGPIVTSSLISKGRSPKYTVGSVSLTEFFVTLASAFTFFMTVGVSHWNIVLGLLIGGGMAAPIAARLAGRLPRKTMMISVGIMVMIWCVRMFIKSL
jgi:uncharacterized membrane protein YfcA